MKKAAPVLLLLLLMVNAGAVSVGTAPGIKEMGTLERGTTHEVTFFITTDATSPFVLEPEYSQPLSDFYEERPGRDLDFDPDEASMEEIGSWTSFRQPQYFVDPSTEKLVSLENGGGVRAQGNVTFDLRIPEDAEPGYHVGSVELNPNLNPDSEGGSLSTIAVTRFRFIFRVPGQVVKNVEQRNIRALRLGDDRARIDIAVQNTGTVTTQVSEADLTILDESGNQVGTLSDTGTTLAPGQTKTITTVWDAGGGRLDAGNYQLSGDLDYVTGNALFDGTFDLPAIDVVEVQEPQDQEGQQQQEKETLPAWLVVMVLVLLGAIMYSFDFDPLWIVLIVGLAAISSFVLMAGLPVWLIAVALIISVFLVYYGGLL